MIFSSDASTVHINPGAMMRDLYEILAAENRRRERDATRYTSLDWDECQMCGAHGEDKRTLFVACFYAVHEVVPEAIDLRKCPDEHLRERGYLLRVCKSCRGRFLAMMGEWRKACAALRGVPKDHDGHPEERDPERCIPVRANGAVEWLTEDEWKALHG